MKKILLVLVLHIAIGGGEVLEARSLSSNGVTTAVRDFMQRSKVLVATAMAVALLSVPVGYAQDGDQQGKMEERQWQEIDNERYFSVLYMVLDFMHTKRSHIAYLGNDHEGRALFLGLRFNVLDVPHVQGKLLFGAEVAYLVDHEGLALEEAQIEEIRVFTSPDNNEIRLYDMTLLAVEGLDTTAYQPLKLAHFPKSGTELDLVSYHVPVPVDPDNWNWQEDVLDSPLLQQRCRAGRFMPQSWVVRSNCNLVVPPAPVGFTAPVFAAEHLVGFGFIEENLVGIPDVVVEHVQHALAVDARPSLPVTWGEIKNRGR